MLYDLEGKMQILFLVYRFEREDESRYQDFLHLSLVEVMKESVVQRFSRLYFVAEVGHLT